MDNGMNCKGYERAEAEFLESRKMVRDDEDEENGWDCPNCGGPTYNKNDCCDQCFSEMEE